jgi:undecaprenyl-diphosphatase
MINGLVLLGAEQLRRRSRPGDEPLDSEYVDERVSGPQSDKKLAAQPVGRAVLIGSAQILALAPGISRSGITMVGGMLRGLSREDAARFSFLLATPVILAAGALKLGDLSGPLGSGIRGQVLFGSVLSGVGAYLSVRFLTRYLANRSLRPFGIYCLVVGAASVILFVAR